MFVFNGRHEYFLGCSLGVARINHFNSDGTRTLRLHVVIITIQTDRGELHDVSTKPKTLVLN